MTTLRIQAPLQFPGYLQTNDGGTDTQVLTLDDDGNATWQDPLTISPPRAFHYVDYDFALGMLIERYPEDGEDFIIDPLIEYQEGFIKNEFQLRDDGVLVYIENG